jgi:hypothetical protein
MVMWTYSPERRRSSSTRRSDVARLANGVRECAADDSSIPPEWSGHHPPRNSVLIAMIMNLLTSWHHCSIAEGEVFGPKGLRRSAHVASSVPSELVPGGVTTVVAAECCRCMAAAMATTAVMASWAFVRWDHPTLECEVASCSLPCPQREG